EAGERGGRAGAAQRLVRLLCPKAKGERDPAGDAEKEEREDEDAREPRLHQLAEVERRRVVGRRRPDAEELPGGVRQLGPEAPEPDPDDGVLAKERERRAVEEEPIAGPFGRRLDRAKRRGEAPEEDRAGWIGPRDRRPERAREEDDEDGDRRGEPAPQAG